MSENRPFEELSDQDLKDHRDSGHISQESFDAEWNERYVVQEPETETGPEEGVEETGDVVAVGEPTA